MASVGAPTSPGLAVARGYRNSHSGTLSWSYEHQRYSRLRNIPVAHAVSRAAHYARETMPAHREVQFLRERAKRLRDMASLHQTPLSDQLRLLAHELESRADELEHGGSDED